MIRYSIVSIVSGIVFGTLDGLIHANPLAQRLFSVFKSIAKSSVNVPAGIVIDLCYGFVMAGIFILIYQSLPGKSGWIKGLNYGLIIWFFRVLMYVISTWMMFVIPYETLFYILFAGLGELLVIGLLYGLVLKPKQ